MSVRVLIYQLESLLLKLESVEAQLRIRKQVSVEDVRTVQHIGLPCKPMTFWQLRTADGFVLIFSCIFRDVASRKKNWDIRRLCVDHKSDYTFAVKATPYSTMQKVKKLLNSFSTLPLKSFISMSSEVKIRNISCTSRLQDGKPVYISTPIFYVNAVPHIGHLYSAVLADFFHRYMKMTRTNDAMFSTGTDEHGLKIQQAAASAGKEPKLFCDEVSQEFKRLFDCSDISYTDYIRTTEERHRKAVEYFWKELFSRGFIYKGHYEGWYSTSDESFLPESQVTDGTNKNGQNIKISIDSGNVVEWTTETNYMFKLSEFGDHLMNWLESNPKSVQPTTFHSMVKAWVLAGLKDLSVSRQRNRLEWGIPVPGDDSQTIYVWLDALVNYLTVCGYPDSLSGWPGINIVGKDILKFHAIYWPAFLMAAGLEPPQSVVCHSHWTMDNFKMSKSRGNVVDPFDQLKRYSSDGLRYFLLREGVLHSDGDYSERKVVHYLNVELADTLGNLLLRVTGKVLNPDQVFPQYHSHLFPLGGVKDGSCRASTVDFELIESLQRLPDLVDSHYRSFLAYKGLEEIISCLRQANSFIQRHEPWKLVKEDQDKEWLETVLHVAMETLRVCGILLQPVTPRVAGRLLDRLGISEDQRTLEHTEIFSKSGSRHHLGEDVGPLFSKQKRYEG